MGRGGRKCSRRRSKRAFAASRTDTIELYYLHRVDPETPLETSLGAIKEHRDRGQIRHVGLSEVGVEEIERACQVVPITAVQNRYNLSERGHDDVVDHCEREGIVFVPFFPLRVDGGSCAGEDRGRPWRDSRTGRARLAPAPFTRDAADPRQPLDRARALEPRSARNRAVRRGVRGTAVAPRGPCARKRRG